MEHDEMVTLIRSGVPAGPGVWADLGAGTGNFTRALAELLEPGSTVYAIDRDARAIAGQQHAQVLNNGAVIYPRQQDFMQRLDLPLLDGVLMANALHFIRDQELLLGKVIDLLQPHGRILIVEYDVHNIMRWVPYPAPFTRFVELAQHVGLDKPVLIGQRRSPSSGIMLYAATVTKRVEV
jgi:SAM-dependent methyltransferase